MSKKTKYKQCCLKKKTETGSVQTVSWIPEKFANVGGVVKLKKDDDTWDDGYVVMSASEEAVDEPPDYRKALRQHKKRTGDSLPKGENK
jgi:hypothetical protein